MDFSNAVIAVQQDAGPLLRKAAETLSQEIGRRTGLVLEIGKNTDTVSGRPVIRIGCGTQGPPAKKDGCSVDVDGSRAVLTGFDERGALYAAGRLLRTARWGPGTFLLPDNYSYAGAPAKGIRGSQLGYRAKTNAYDAWTPAMFEQYIRDLALFGASCAEILPPETDDELRNDLMKTDSFEMMRFLSETLHAYGMDVWMWYPNLFGEDADEERLALERAKRDEVFASIPYLDHIFIPGGDPGRLPPEKLFAWSKEVYALAAVYHKNVKLWISPQTGTPSAAWVESFYREADKEPDWLAGVGFAPWERDDIPVLRGRLPAKYPIRNYPDIAHTLRCQYPVENWDLPMAMTLGREFINPRPLDEKHIHNIYAAYHEGSLCYSEGINDDFNKFVWLDQDWDASTPVEETARDYAGVFIDCDLRDEIARGLFSLERNLRGPLELNAGIEETCRLWQTVENRAGTFAKDGYRLYMYVLRACFDLYQQRRYILEKQAEQEALAVLDNRADVTLDEAADKAAAILDAARSQTGSPELHERIRSLADLLFERIGAQLTVSRHFASDWDRGAFVECLDIPLNDYRYIKQKLRALKSKQSDWEKAAALEGIVRRTDPGPGGIYLDCGAPGTMVHFKNAGNGRDDPGFFKTPLVSFLMASPLDDEDGIPLAWRRNVCILYQEPLVVTLEGLDPDADYTVKAVYARYHTVHITLRAGENEEYAVHGEVTVDVPFVETEHPLPKQAYAGGRLTLSFRVRDGERGPNVSEIIVRRVSDA
ncbi:MAG TPA: hypothetical protein PL044_08975 [Clostridiales bacterium]|nr:MAG: hypothetical protein BWY37_01407 [Firmicutes bacterium ADurb.Bin262]HOU10615.1 hypothetical protein [Clostridiales bacterium]HQH62446.1 hypothetical protein [Clostridiales bacterium]HQK73883.1 hypothetical protein [Clostridiales bacterium]